MTIISFDSTSVTTGDKDRSPSAITLFCGVGLVASFYLISFGVNLGAGWL
jgi:hypothetical protein